VKEVTRANLRKQLTESDDAHLEVSGKNPTLSATLI